MQTITEAAVVVLSERDAASALALRGAAPAAAIRWFASVEDLMHEQPLSAIGVLVIDSRTQPPGVLLAALGRMNVEYPAMQKIAVLDEPPPLPVASYLTACGVDLVWPAAGEESIEKLATAVARTRERTNWIVN